MVRANSYPVLAVCALVLMIAFFRLGAVTLFDVDEAVFAEATKEMVRSGNWITPTYNGENRYDKPILFYWMMAASYGIFGVNEFSARFPSALSGFMLCLAVYFLVRRFQDERSALYACAALSLSIFFVVYTHAAVTDMALTLFISLSLFSFYLSIRGERRFIYGFYFFAACACLTKGLIGIVFPFGIAFIFLALTERIGAVKKIWNVKAAILFLAVAAPWYLTEYYINGNDFVQQFLIKHHFRRYTGVISGHRGPLYYFIPVLIIGLFPWIAYFVAGIRRVAREKDNLNLFALVWASCIVLFFSFSTTKLPNYVLPAVPAASILIAHGMADSDIRWRKYSNILLAVLSFSLGVCLLIFQRYLPAFHVQDTGWIFAAAAISFLLTLLGIYAALAGKISYAGVACLAFLLLFILSLKALPVVNRHLQGTLYRYSLYAGKALQDGDRIIAYGINNPSIVFYSGHKVADVKNRNDLVYYVESGKKAMAITKAKDVELFEKLNFGVLEQDGKYALLERK